MEEILSKIHVRVSTHYYHKTYISNLSKCMIYRYKAYIYYTYNILEFTTTKEKGFEMLISEGCTKNINYLLSTE